MRPKTYRTAGQSVGTALVAIFFAAVFLFGYVPIQARKPSANVGDLWVMSVILITLCLFFVFRVARAGVLLTETHVIVRNPLRTYSFPTRDVLRFSLGPWRQYSQIALLEVRDARVVHIFGIQANAPLAGRRHARTAIALIEELNELIRMRQAEGTH